MCTVHVVPRRHALAVWWPTVILYYTYNDGLATVSAPLNKFRNVPK